MITATGINQTELPNNITLYPNPASDQINLEGIEAGTAMEIYDLLGRRLYQAATRTNPEALDIRGLAAGTYLLRLTDDKGRTFPYTFVKQ